MMQTQIEEKMPTTQASGKPTMPFAPDLDYLFQSDKRYGSPTPGKWSLLELAFALAILMVILVPLFLVVTPWVQTAQGSGKVIAFDPEKRQQTLEAPVSGRISDWLVQEGSRVTAGQPLVELADMDPQILERLRSQRAAVMAKVAATEQALKVSRRNLERQRQLAKEGLSSQRAVEKAELEVTKHQSDLSSAQAEKAEVDVKFSRQASQVVRAPVDGELVRIYAAQGGVVVKEGDSLALLVPESDDRVVEFWVSGLDLPLISEGRKVRLQFEGWPAVQFSGWPSIAVGTFGGLVKQIDASGNGDGRYRVLVFPDPSEMAWPDTRYLRQGVRVVGWVLLDEVSMAWELWRQMNGFPKTVEEPISG